MLSPRQDNPDSTTLSQQNKKEEEEKEFRGTRENESEGESVERQVEMNDQAACGSFKYATGEKSATLDTRSEMWLEWFKLFVQAKILQDERIKSTFLQIIGPEVYEIHFKRNAASRIISKCDQDRPRVRKLGTRRFCTCKTDPKGSTNQKPVMIELVLARCFNAGNAVGPEKHRSMKRGGKFCLNCGKQKHFAAVRKCPKSDSPGYKAK